MALGFGHAVTKFCGNDARVGNTRFYSPVRVLCMAPAWGTVMDTIISVPSRAPLSGVLVTLTNGYAGATNEDGVYSFLVPPGTYTAKATDVDRNCTSASPANPTVNITSGGTTNQNFTMAGTSNLEENHVTIDDTTSGGNGNGVINRNECVNLNVELKNNGCAGKACPGGIGTPGTRFFKTFGPFINSAGVPACITVTINAATGGGPNTGDIESAAYLGTYNPANLCLNYLGDSGISGLGTTVGSASYSFTVPAGANFVVVVNTTGTTDSTQFSGTVSGFFDNTAGPGPCAQ
jgi:hypothetical protein